MTDKLHAAWHLIKYYFKAKTIFQVHSPFLYNFCKGVLQDDRHFQHFDKAESIRTLLLQTPHSIDVEDFGAGSQVMKYNSRKVSDICKTSVSPQYQCRFIFRLVNYFQPKHLIEIGTSLGVASLYQSFGANNAPLITLEGSEKIAQIAQLNFNKLSRNIKIVKGNFDNTLDTVLSEVESLDYILIDGNHREKATIEYFEKCLLRHHNETIIVFDDIYWSPGMTRAWEYIKNHPSVTCSVDVYFFGIVFFKKEFKEKTHLQVIPKQYKPWQIGWI